MNRPTPHSLRHLITASALAFACATHAKSPITDPPFSALGEVGPKIVGGSTADAGENRWITSIQYAREHFCGGALVAPRWVMTAAHCMEGESASDPNLTVWVGGNALTNEGQGVRRDVVQIIRHANYNDSTLANDIALLKLSANVNFTPVVMATSEIMQGPAAPGQPVTASGWGALAESGGFPNRLNEVVLPVVSNNVCNRAVSYGGDVLANQLCAGLAEGGRDSCQGDSGGPLWLNHNGVDVQVGIVSWGDGCAQPNKYGVYTRAANYRNWVQNRVGTLPLPDSGGGGEPPADPDPTCSGPNASPVAAILQSCGNLPSGVWLTNQRRTRLSGATGSTRTFAVQVPDEAFRLQFNTSSGTGDVDIYVAFGRQATHNDHDLSSIASSNSEKIRVDNPQAGTWYVTLHGYASYERVVAQTFIWSR